MPDAEAQQPGEVQLLDPDGAPATVAPSELALALKQGYRQATPEEAQHAADLQEAGEHPLEAAALGAAQNVPYAPSIVAGVGGPSLEQQRNLAEANPVATGAGNLAGMVGLQAIPGLGEVADANKARGAAEAILDSGRIVKSAAEMGALGLTNNISEQDLANDGEVNLSAAAEAMAGNALMGAVADPLFALGGRAISKGVEAASDATGKASDALAGILGRATGALRTDITETTGADALQGAMRETYEAAQAGVPNAGREMTRAAATDMAGAMNEALEKAFDLRQEVMQQHLPAAIDATMGPQPLSTAAAGMDRFAANVVEPALVRFQQGIDAGEMAYKKPFADLQRAWKSYREAAEEATTTPELYSAARELRQSIDKGMKYGKLLSATESDSINAIEQGVQTPLRQALVDPQIWGKAGTDMMHSFNEATRSSLNAEEMLLKKLGGRDILTDAVRPEKEIKAQKLQTLFNGADKLSQDDARGILSKFLETTGDYTDMASDLSKIGKTAVDSESLQELLKTVADRKSTGEASAMLQRRAPWEQGSGQLSTAALLASHAMPSLLPVGAALRAGAGLMDTVRDPTRALQVLGSLKRLALKHQDAITRGAKAFLNGSKPLVRALAVRGAESEPQARATKIRALASNPTLLQNTLVRNTEGLQDAAPKTTMMAQQAATARLAVLHAALPPPPQPSMVPTAAVPPDPEAVAHFDRVHAAVMQPVKAILEGMHSNRLTPDMVAAVQATSPATLQSLRSALQNEIVDNPKRQYSYAQKEMLSLVMGAPAAPECDPMQTMFQQITFQHPAPQAPAQAGAAGKTRAKGLDSLHLAQGTALPEQQREMERNS